jgi:hypothetical protein
MCSACSIGGEQPGLRGFVVVEQLAILTDQPLCLKALKGRIRSDHRDAFGQPAIKRNEPSDLLGDRSILNRKSVRIDQDMAFAGRCSAGYSALQYQSSLVVEPSQDFPCPEPPQFDVQKAACHIVIQSKHKTYPLSSKRLSGRNDLSTL